MRLLIRDNFITCIKFRKNIITAVFDIEGNVVTERHKILDECRSFYESLCKSIGTDVEDVEETERKTVNPILASEIKVAICTMKEGKASGNDGLVIELLKVADDR